MIIKYNKMQSADLTNFISSHEPMESLHKNTIHNAVEKFAMPENNNSISSFFVELDQNLQKNIKTDLKCNDNICESVVDDMKWRSTQYMTSDLVDKSDINIDNKLTYNKDNKKDTLKMVKMDVNNHVVANPEVNNDYSATRESLSVEDYSFIGNVENQSNSPSSANTSDFEDNLKIDLADDESNGVLDYSKNKFIQLKSSNIQDKVWTVPQTSPNKVSSCLGNASKKKNSFLIDVILGLENDKSRTPPLIVPSAPINPHHNQMSNPNITPAGLNAFGDFMCTSDEEGLSTQQHHNLRQLINVRKRDYKANNDERSRLSYENYYDSCLQFRNISNTRHIPDTVSSKNWLEFVTIPPVVEEVGVGTIAEQVFDLSVSNGFQGSRGNSPTLPQDLSKPLSKKDPTKMTKRRKTVQMASPRLLLDLGSRPNSNSSSHSSTTIPALVAEGDTTRDIQETEGNIKKTKKARTTFSGRQIFELEKLFEKKKYLSSSERSEMAELLSVTDTQVKIWFQNRRTKWKKQENISNAEAAELKSIHKTDEKDSRKLVNRSTATSTDSLVLDMSMKKKENLFINVPKRFPLPLVNKQTKRSTNISKNGDNFSSTEKNDKRKQISENDDVVYNLEKYSLTGYHVTKFGMTDDIESKISVSRISNPSPTSAPEPIPSCSYKEHEIPVKINVTSNTSDESSD